jgi:uncharacterized protein
MEQTLRTIDSDGHVLEPGDLWENYIEPKYRENCLKVFMGDDGFQKLRVEKGKTLDFKPSDDDYFSLGSAGAIGARDVADSQTRYQRYEDGRKGGFDPHARIPDMDTDGVDAAVLYPSLGLFLPALKDPGYAAAACRAYNKWLADYCKPYPDRLFGAAAIPLQSPELAVQEMRYAVEELGYRAGFVRPNPYSCRRLYDRENDVFWKAAAEMDFAIGLHSSAGFPSFVACDRFENTSSCVNHLVEHTFEMMAAATGMIMCGPCDRFPALRVGFLEAGGGWMAGLLDRMDRHFDDVNMNDTELKTRPSEIFERQCFISFEPVENSLKHLASYIGPKNILWATDYPHVDGFWGAVGMIEGMELQPEVQNEILSGGAKRFYKLWD